jgi:multisubunit Na+/H+ antiporter MnhG subunit
VTVVVVLLLAVAAVVTAASATAALVVADLPSRLHLVTPVTAVAGPALGLAAALTLGWSTATAAVVVVVVLLAATAPVLQTAIARAARVAACDAPDAQGEEAP